MEEKTTISPRFNYTMNAWQGKRYNANMTTKDIASAIRAELKKAYPMISFSITSTHNTLKVAMMSAPFEAMPANDSDRGHTDVNHYYIKESNRMTEEAKQVMLSVRSLCDSYNFDDSDSQIDYFHTNFYLTLSIGKWDKAFTNSSK